MLISNYLFDKRNLINKINTLIGYLFNNNLRNIDNIIKFFFFEFLRLIFFVINFRDRFDKFLSTFR